MWNHSGIWDSTNTVFSHFKLYWSHSPFLSRVPFLSFFKVWWNYRDVFVNSVIGCQRWPLLIFRKAFGSQWLAFLFTYVFVWQKGNTEIHFWFIVNNLLENVSKSKNYYMVCWFILVRYGLFVPISRVLYILFC